jgi:hypothetical protein
MVMRMLGPGRTRFWARRLLTRALRRPFRGRRRVSVLLIGLVLIAGWQRDFFARASRLDDRYIHRESSGITQEWRFAYFLYYLGLYPVVANEGHARMRGEPGYRKFEREAAERVIAERGETLSMEAGVTIRSGDMGRALLYMPHAIWRGSARDPRLAPTHAVAFTLALCALYAAFWWVRDPTLGALAVALLGSNPYQLYEVHAHENVFGWSITAGVATLALSLPLLARRGAGRRAWLLPLSIGVLLGSVRQIRPEPVTILASAAAACLLLSRASWRRRGALAAILLASFFATTRVWLAYFDHRFEEARRVVAAAGGRVYEGPRDRYHTFWHPLWCGLGDFGQKYGYEWRDKTAARYAGKLVEERYRALGREPDWRYFYWDPIYDEVLREKIRHDVTHDPLWYLGVLARRVGRVVTWTTPLRIAAGSWSIDLPLNGLATLTLVAALAWTRSWSLLKLALFPLGTSLPAVLVFSGTVPGQTYTGWFHVIGAAILLAALAETAALLGRRRWRAPQTDADRRTTGFA